MLEAVKRERKVAWLLLGNAAVDSLTDGVLTLRFAREGEAKGFTGSGCDQDLARVLQAMFGLTPQIRAAAGPAGSGGHGGPASGGGPGGRGGPAGPGSSPGPGAQGQPAAGRPAQGRAEALRRPDRPAPPDEDFPEDPDPYDGADGRPGTGNDSLTGMDLIERELGGKVIEELGG